MAALAPPTSSSSIEQLAPGQLADSIVQSFDSILILDFGQSCINFHSVWLAPTEQECMRYV